MLEVILKDFIALWAVIDPIGTIPVFLIATKKFSAEAKRKIALKATLTSLGILLFFIVAGQLLLDALSIPLAAFQIAGGIILFLFALTMVFGESKPESEITEARHMISENEAAVFPLAVPSIASPGAMMMVVLLTNNNHFKIVEQTTTTAVMVVVLLITFILMLFAGKISKIIGRHGASVISRVMGLILASVAVTSVLQGIKEYFSI